MELCLVLIPVLIIAGLLVWFISSGMDRERIREYVESRGGKVLALARLPLGEKWWEQWKERSYAIRYADGDGHEHEGRVQTGLWTGMHWSEDNIVRYADQIKKEKNPPTP